MTRILFVEEDPRELAAFQNGLGNQFADWEMVFVADGEEAFERMTQSPFDAVAASATATGMDGMRLLAHIAQFYPQAVRILLSQQESQQTIDQLVGPAQQYLSKPCDPSLLREAVERAFVLRDLLTDDKLKRLVSRVQALPTVPGVYAELLCELRSENPSVSNLAQLVSQDLGICAKLLQLVNSPFFGLQQDVAHPAEAIIYLGLNTVRNIVLSLGVLSGFERSLKDFSFDRVWKHSWATGGLAKSMVETEKLGAQEADHAFTSGLLHDVGKLVLASGLTAEYQKVVAVHRQSGKPLWEAELEIFGSTHAEVGAYLLALWGLPTPLVRAVALHHRPSAGPNKSFSLATALHVANCLEHENSQAASRRASSQINLAYLAELGLQERIDHWRKQTQTRGYSEAA